MPGHLCLQIGSFVAMAALSAPVVLWFKWTLHSMVSETEPRTWDNNKIPLLILLILQHFSGWIFTETVIFQTLLNMMWWSHQVDRMHKYLSHFLFAIISNSKEGITQETYFKT